MKYITISISTLFIINQEVDEFNHLLHKKSIFNTL